MPLRNLQLSSKITANLGNVQYQDVTDQLPKNPKNTWAQLAGTREINHLTTLVLHHDALSKSKTASLSDMQLMTNIANSHINNTAYDATGEGGIPYHVFIRNSRIYQCNDLQDRTYGVGNNNGYTVHIVVSGDYFNYDTLTDGDRNALYAAILMVLDVLPNFKEIKGHSELNPTKCPGYDVNKVRSDIQTIQMKMMQSETEDGLNERAYTIANQILFTYNTAKGLDQYGQPTISEGNRKWAQQKLLSLEGKMKEEGLLT